MSHQFIAPTDEVPFPSEADGIDFEGEFGIITGDVPMGCSADDALAHVRLIVVINGWSLRAVAPVELKTGFGWVQAKSACSMAPRMPRIVVRCPPAPSSDRVPYRTAITRRSDRPASRTVGPSRRSTTARREPIFSHSAAGSGWRSKADRLERSTRSSASQLSCNGTSLSPASDEQFGSLRPALPTGPKRMWGYRRHLGAGAGSSGPSGQ